MQALSFPYSMPALAASREIYSNAYTVMRPMQDPCGACRGRASGTRCNRVQGRRPGVSFCCAAAARTAVRHPAGPTQYDLYPCRSAVVCAGPPSPSPARTQSSPCPQLFDRALGWLMTCAQGPAGYHALPRHLRCGVFPSMPRTCFRLLPTHDSACLPAVDIRLCPE